jgi:hypothetical protein
MINKTIKTFIVSAMLIVAGSSYARSYTIINTLPDSTDYQLTTDAGETVSMKMQLGDSPYVWQVSGCLNSIKVNNQQALTAKVCNDALITIANVQGSPKAYVK